MGIVTSAIAGLSTEAQTASYQLLAASALQNYGFEHATPVLLQHNSGITYKVTVATPPSCFLLKIHDPVGEGNAEPRIAIQTRMTWLAELGQAAHIHVQSPIPGRTGLLVTSVQLPVMYQPVAATLQVWIEGDHPAGDFTARQLALVGESMAQLHTYSTTHPAALPDATLEELRHAVQQLEAAVTLHLLSGAQYHLLEQVTGVLTDIVRQLGRDREVWGPIHGDIHHGNLLFMDNAIALIDFDSLHNGYYLLDLGTTLYHILHQEVSMRQHFIDSYIQRRPLPSAHLAYLEAFVTWAALSNLAFQITIPEQRASPYFARNLRQVVDSFCPHVLAGQPFVAV